MSGIQRFEDIIAWQKSQDLTILIYETFKNCRDFSFVDQIKRAVVSISNNIAEGFDRHSKKEFANFLYIARGSCSEVRSMLHLSQRLNLIDDKTHSTLVEKSNEIARILTKLISSLVEKKRHNT